MTYEKMSQNKKARLNLEKLQIFQSEVGCSDTKEETKDVRQITKII